MYFLFFIIYDNHYLQHIYEPIRVTILKRFNADYKALN